MLPENCRFRPQMSFGYLLIELLVVISAGIVMLGLAGTFVFSAMEGLTAARRVAASCTASAVLW